MGHGVATGASVVPPCSTMKYVVAFVLGIWGTIGVYQWNSFGEETLPQGYEYSDMSVFTHPTESRCIGTGNNVSFDIGIVFEDLEDDTIGEWRPESQEIALEDMTVDTMAHEVSHAVEDILEDHGIQHEHLEAYLQGYLTQCVYDIVVRAHERVGLDYPQE